MPLYHRYRRYRDDNFCYEDPQDSCEGCGNKWACVSCDCTQCPTCKRYGSPDYDCEWCMSSTRWKAEYSDDSDYGPMHHETLYYDDPVSEAKQEYDMKCWKEKQQSMKEEKCKQAKLRVEAKKHEKWMRKPKEIKDPEVWKLMDELAAKKEAEAKDAAVMKKIEKAKKLHKKNDKRILKGKKRLTTMEFDERYKPDLTLKGHLEEVKKNPQHIKKVPKHLVSKQMIESVEKSNQFVLLQLV